MWLSNMFFSYFGSERNSSNASINFIKVYDNKQMTYIGTLYFCFTPTKKGGDADVCFVFVHYYFAL